jgi:hypothetical protein
MKLQIFFNFTHLPFFNLSNLVPILFIAICFLLDHFLDFFLISSSLSFLSIKFDLYFFYCYLFCSYKFFILIFFFTISSFKIKLIEN